MKKTFLKIILFLILLSSIRDTFSKDKDEWKNWKVKRIDILGNKEFKKIELFRLIELSPHLLKKPPLFSSKKLMTDIEAVEIFYKNNGFLSVKIESDVIPDSTKKELRIKIKIDEGEKYCISDVIISEKDSILPLLKKFLCKKGTAFKLSSVEHDKRLLKEWYGKKGYIFSEIMVNYKIDTIYKSVDIIFTIDKGRLAVVDSIIINGNSKLKNYIINRELRFNKGDILTTDKINKSEYRLYSTELISSVNIEAEIDSLNKDNKVDSGRYSLCFVNINIRESHFFRFKLGAGYGSDEGFRGTVEASQRNLFDLGHKITLKGKISQTLQEAKSIYTIPWFLNLPIYFDGSLYYTRYSNRETYRGLLRGIMFSFEYSFDFPLTFMLWTKFDDVLWISSIELPEDVPLKNTQSIGLDITFDKRNDMLDPSNGFYSLLKTEAAGLTGINSNQFLKFTTDTRIYWEYGKLRFGSALRSGWARPYGKDNEVPLQERFFIGGSRSVRGFRENFLLTIKDSTLHPKSGTFMITSNIIEMRFPLVWIIGGAFFVDGGLLSDNITNKNLREITKEIRWAAGTGIRVNTPLAIFRLDIGFKLNKKSYEDLYQIHLDIGQSF